MHSHKFLSEFFKIPIEHFSRFILDLYKTPWFQVFSVIFSILSVSTALIGAGVTMVFFAICNCIVAQMKTLQYLLININTDIHDKNIAFILDYHLKVEQCLISFNKIFFIIMNQLFLYYPIIICTLGFTVVTVSAIILEKKHEKREKIYFQATDRSIQIQMTVFTLAGTFGLFAFSYAADKVIQEVHNFLNKLRF